MSSKVVVFEEKPLKQKVQSWDEVIPIFNILRSRNKLKIYQYTTIEVKL